MKTIATISTMILAATLAVAQSAPAKTSPKKPAAPASQSSTGKAATPMTATSTTAAKSTTAKKAAKAPAATAMAKPPAAKPAEGSGEELGKGKRDPFISPVITRVVGPGGPACTSGPHCLIIDQVKLQGTVKTEKGWIAVLANPANKVYYLRQNDAMFDGYVERIDANSVVFKQDVLDAMGRKTQREVVKSVLPSA